MKPFFFFRPLLPATQKHDQVHPLLPPANIIKRFFLYIHPPPPPLPFAPFQLGVVVNALIKNLVEASNRSVPPRARARSPLPLPIPPPSCCLNELPPSRTICWGRHPLQTCLCSWKARWRNRSRPTSSGCKRYAYHRIQMFWFYIHP